MGVGLIFSGWFFSGVALLAMQLTEDQGGGRAAVTPARRSTGDPRSSPSRPVSWAARVWRPITNALTSPAVIAPNAVACDEGGVGCQRRRGLVERLRGRVQAIDRHRL